VRKRRGKMEQRVKKRNINFPHPLLIIPPVEYNVAITCNQYNNISYKNYATTTIMVT